MMTPICTPVPSYIFETFEGWPDSEDDYELKEVIGVGAIGVVYGSVCKTTLEKCAIKKIDLAKWNTNMDALLSLEEIHIISACNHENIVTCYSSFNVRDELWLVFPFLEGGSLLDIIKHKMRTTNCQNGIFEEATIATILKEILKGLEYIHSTGQFHGDIKAGNILLGEDGAIQIADFGVKAWLVAGRNLSRSCRKVTFVGTLHAFVGTIWWMAPEVMEDYGYDLTADIWSFGITAIEIATGTAPYHKYPPMKVVMLTLLRDPPTLDTGAEVRDQYIAYSKTFRKLIIDCLQKDPTKRPKEYELLKYPFFKKAKDKKYLQETLLAIGPSLETRIQKAAKIQPGAYGKLHRIVKPGEWVS